MPERVGKRLAKMVLVVFIVLFWVSSIHYWRWYRLLCRFWPPAKRRILLVVCLCLHVSLYVSYDNFRKPWRRKFIFVHASAHRPNTGGVRIWRSSGQGQGHRSQKGRKFLSPQCKTSIGNNSRSLKHTAMTSACSMEFSDTANRMV